MYSQTEKHLNIMPDNLLTEQTEAGNEKWGRYDPDKMKVTMTPPKNAADIEKLIQIPNLAQLDVNICRETKVTQRHLEKISKIYTLRSLELSGMTDIIDFSCLVSMRDLENLSLHAITADQFNTLPSDMLRKESWDDASSLKSLNLTYTQIADKDFDAIFQKFPDLVSLHIDNSYKNNEITEKSVATITKLKHLRDLNAMSVNVGDDGFVRILSSLPELESLSLFYSDITDEALKNAPKSTKLKVLEVPFTNISARGLELIAEKFPNLERLVCEIIPDDDKNTSENITAGFKALAKLEHLKHLDVGYHDEEHCNLLKAIPNLEEFQYEGCNVTKEFEYQMDQHLEMNRIRNLEKTASNKGVYDTTKPETELGYMEIIAGLPSQKSRT